MKRENINDLSEEIRKINYRINYKINETPKYRPLIGTNEEFDEIPQLTSEAGEPKDVSKPAGSKTQPTFINTDASAGVPAKTPVPAFDKNGGETSATVGSEQSSAKPMIVAPETDVDNIQNEIIKHNIKAMKSIHDKLENLDTMVQEINNKIEQLNADVKEVREPTNAEKLMNKTSVSYPYYFNLNDFWSGNWFNQKYEKEMNDGIRELPDGTFVADFDDLPHKSKIDLENSFYEYIK